MGDRSRISEDCGKTYSRLPGQLGVIALPCGVREPLVHIPLLALWTTRSPCFLAFHTSRSLLPTRHPYQTSIRPHCHTGYIGGNNLPWQGQWHQHQSLWQWNERTWDQEANNSSCISFGVVDVVIMGLLCFSFPFVASYHLQFTGSRLWRIGRKESGDPGEGDAATGNKPANNRSFQQGVLIFYASFTNFLLPPSTPSI